jgi:hypothetical protein
MTESANCDIVSRGKGGLSGGKSIGVYWNIGVMEERKIEPLSELGRRGRAGENLPQHPLLF